MARRPRASAQSSVAANALLVALGCILAFSALEAVLRVFQPFQFRVRGNRIVLPVNVEYRIGNTHSDKLDRRIVHRKNSLGFRGPDPPLDPASYLTIVAVGGSTTECFFLADGREWASMLSKSLGSVFERVWINNAGLDGQTSFGHLVLLTDYLASLRPKLVLYLVGLNDMGLEGASFYDDRMMARLSFSSLTSLVVSAANQSDVLTLLLNLYRYAAARQRGVTHEAILDLRELSREVSDPSAADSARIARLREERYLAAYSDRLRRLVGATRKAGSEPILITQAALYGSVVDDVTGVDLAPLLVHGISARLAWEILELYNDATRRVGGEERVLVLDLARMLPKSSRYYYDWVHYTNEGAAATATILAAGLCPHLAAEYPELYTGDCRGLELAEDAPSDGP